MPLPGKHAGADAVEQAVEAVGEHLAVVGLAVAVRVGDQLDALGVLPEAIQVADEVPPQHGLAIGEGAVGQLGVEQLLGDAGHARGRGGPAKFRRRPGVAPAVVQHRAVVVDPVRLGDVGPPLLVERESDRILQQRLGRPHRRLQPARQGNHPRRLRRRIAGAGGAPGRRRDRPPPGPAERGTRN